MYGSGNPDAAPAPPVPHDSASNAVMMPSAEHRTLMIGVTSLRGQYSDNIPTFASGVLIAAIPVLLVYLFLQRQIAEHAHAMARMVEDGLTSLGYRQSNKAYFDTLWIEGADASAVRREAEAAGMNFRYSGGAIGLSVDETTTSRDALEIVTVFARAAPTDAGAP